MKIIEQSHEILRYDSLELIEQAGRTCYRSEEKIGCTRQDCIDKDLYNLCGECEFHSSHAFVRGLIKRHHEAMLEFGGATVRFVTDRGVTHELVRHRPPSFCLDEKTEVVAFRDEKVAYSSKKKWTLRQLWDWQADAKRKGRIKLIRLRSVDESGRIVPGRIKRVIDSGVKEMLEVKCVSGRTIRATKDHLFRTPDGWARLGDLIVGNRVIANGLPALENREWLDRVYLKENNTLQETATLAGCCVACVTKALRRYGINKPLSMRKNRQPGHGVKGMHSDEERRCISERMAGSGNHRWKGEHIASGSGRCRANRMYAPDVCWGCGKAEKIERHHMDGNPINNASTNIKYLCQKCHKGFHYGQSVLTVFSDEITSITSVGEAQAFDLEMENEPHNFVANGLVVHNSQESTRYCNYGGQEINFIRPSWCEESIVGGGLQPNNTYDRWKYSMLEAERTYNDLLELGWQPEHARTVLPHSLATTIVVKANYREWRHILNLRAVGTTGRPHPQMHALMLALLQEFKTLVPVIFDDLEAK